MNSNCPDTFAYKRLSDLYGRFLTIIRRIATKETLSWMPNKNWVAKRDEFIDVVKDLPIVFSIFCKANARVENDVLSLDTCS